VQLVDDDPTLDGTEGTLERLIDGLDGDLFEYEPGMFSGR